MPEIKHNFTKGRMNKDLDERIIPNGEYRDAMNIQVSTSEGSDVGTVQNILGNSEVNLSGVGLDNIIESIVLPNDCICIGSVSDEKKDTLYMLLTGSNKDIIVEYNTNTKEALIVIADMHKTNSNRPICLNFDVNSIITGINIIDGMLFWTDNNSEPKKINIQRCKDGNPNNKGHTHTKLVKNGEVTSEKLKESHITVIKKSPKHPLTLEYEAFRDPLKNYTGVMEISDSLSNENSLLNSSIGYIHDFSFLNVGDTFKTTIETDIVGNEEFYLDWQNWMPVVIKEFTGAGGAEAPSIPISNYTIKGKITDWDENKFYNENPQLVVNTTFDDDSNWIFDSYWHHSSFKKRFEYDPYTPDASNPATRVLAGNGNEKLKVSVASSGLNDDIKQDRIYRVEYTIKKVAPTIPLEGEVIFRIVDDTGKYETSTPQSANGTHSEDITITASSTAHPNSYENVLYFESHGGPSNPIPFFVGSIDDVTITDVTPTDSTRVEIRIDSIDGIPPTVEDTATSLKYAIDKFDTEEKLFEFKFPRFAYRYKYEDGEYSTFSPFTEIAFVPGSFDYHPKKGYNLGMTNNLKSLTIKGFKRLIPEDVKSIDILYKEEHSPNIYIVDTIKDLDKVEYKITSETIKNGVVPSNQLLRPWDNVPRKALAQDIVGNRIVYGNYKQNYDLKTNDGFGNLTDYDISIESTIVSPKPNNSRVGKKSIKSLREYQVGVVYTDEYGRETPVLTSSSDTLKVSKDLSAEINQLQVRIINEGIPINMKYFKFYVKDTGGEYYNLAMDRYYDAKDDNIWLAFPSTDRNKLDIDDFIILKKGVGQVTNDKDLIKEKAQYKILDIQNEAPDFIKRKETLIASKLHTDGDFFLSNDLPAESDINFSVDYDVIQNSSYANLHEDFSKDSDVEYHISLNNTDTNRTSNRYKIIQLHNREISSSDHQWKFTLEHPFTNEINSFTDDPTGVNVTEILNNTYLNIYRTAVDKSASHKFDGRFFVKIYNDDIFKRTLKEKHDEDENKEYKSIGHSRKIYSLKTHSGNHLDKHYDSGYEVFKDIETEASSVGLHDRTSNFKTSTIQWHTWENYSLVTDRFGKYLGTLNGKKEAANFSKFGNRTTVNTRDTRIWREYDAYFRGINTYLGDDAVRLDRVNKLDLHGTNADDQKFEDVWFIDEAKSAGHFFHSSSDPNANTGWDTRPYTWFKNSVGLTGDGKGHGILELAFGGIQPNDWSTSSDGVDNDPSFYDLSDQNLNYSEKESDFIKNIAVGSQFRFKEDPDHTVYTVMGVDIFLRARYESLLNYSNHDTNFVRNISGNSSVSDPQLQPKHLFPFHAKAREGKASGWDTSSGNVSNANNTFGGTLSQTGKGLATNLSTTGLIFATNSYLRPSNYTKNWRLTLDKSFTGNWNPLETGASPISGGSPINLTATGSSKNSITTTSITGIGNNKNQLSIGMVLKRYVTTDLTIPAIVSEISETGGVYTVKFKTYGGEEDFASSGAGSIAAIANTNVLAFYQYPMNNLSPNSAKNLNFFRDGKRFNSSKAGTDAVGYTLEWVEEKTYRSEEEVLPKNPAIWETKPKENPDLDIYYEASGRIPINIELTESNLLDFIPIGSIVEHESSNTIPPGTVIESIDINNQKITLSNDIEIIIPPGSAGLLGGGIAPSNFSTSP